MLGTNPALAPLIILLINVLLFIFSIRGSNTCAIKLFAEMKKDARVNAFRFEIKPAGDKIPEKR